MFKRSLWKIVHHSTPLQISKHQQVPFVKVAQISCKHPASTSGTNSAFMDLGDLITDRESRCTTKARELCQKHLSGIWKTISPQEIFVTPITGGMSNTILRCSLPESMSVEKDEPSEVLVRLYGDLNSSDDKSVQLKIFSLLSSIGMGPRLYGASEDGRLEEFIPADAMTLKEMVDPQISSIIAKKLAIISRLEVPIDKNNLWLRDRYEEFLRYVEKEIELESYLNESDLPKTTEVIARELLEKDLRSEKDFMMKAIEQIKSPVVFSHNDLHHGNILLAKASKKRPTLDERIILIDFEYSGYNYQSYDLANHLCEWCFEYDSPEYPHFSFYPDKLPNEQQQREVVRNYLKQQKQLLKQQAKTDKEPAHEALGNGDLHSMKPTDVVEEDAILAEIKTLMMAVNLLWSIWCMKCAHQANIRFGFWEHAMARWKLYSEMKSRHLSRIK